MKNVSIGLRLTIWYVAIFALAQLAFGAGMWFILRHNLYDIADDGLESQVEDLKNFLQAQPKDQSIERMQQLVAGAYSLEHSGDYLQIDTATGQPIYHSPFLQAHPLPAVVPGDLKQFSLTDRVLDGRPLRFVTQKVEANGQTYVISSGLLIDDVVGT
ncbi:MAG TPA: hypothetical protein VI386_35875, partial [Candidatus Sulfotelmatobacter sp.]